MRSAAAVACGLVVTLSSCGGEEPPEGVSVEARQDVVVTMQPLGDVVRGHLDAGDVAVATCFVPRAQTNTGASGSAVRVWTEDVEGYASLTDFPDDPADRRPVFDLDAEELLERLPRCPDED